MTIDRRVVFVVVATLAATVLLSLIGQLVLAFVHTAAPPAVTHAFDVAIGAIGGLLARVETPPAPGDPPPPPTPVVVEQPEGDSIPTHQAARIESRARTIPEAVAAPGDPEGTPRRARRAAGR